MPSGYRSDRILVVERLDEPAGLVWKVVEKPIIPALEIEYDSGRLDEWLETYLEEAPLESLHFLAAFERDRYVGLLTWRQLEWNNTLWLIDIRTAAQRRRSGVGTAMLAELYQTARRLEARGIAVETQNTNYPALSFYRKNCFQIAGLNEHLYDTDSHLGEVAIFLFRSTYLTDSAGQP